MFFSLEQWEMASYVVTVVGLPFAIAVFVMEQQKERQNEDEELYQRLADEYAEVSKILLDNADLQLFSGVHVPEENLSAEQKERKKIIFDLVISLFERAYLLVYEERMSKQTKRLWATWDDTIRFWVKRPDFFAALDELLVGEDPDFVQLIRSIADSERKKISPS